MPSLFDHETTVAYLKSVTDEDAEAQLRHPTLWSYIARDPTGMVYSSGRKRTRAECERVQSPTRGSARRRTGPKASIGPPMAGAL
jgi:hypothetical protein